MRPLNCTKSCLPCRVEPMSQRNRETVYVGLSGGVDSSVSALLLQEQGYHVVGVFIRTWQPDFITCSWREERRDAMRVAAHLGIPFKELDLEEAYKKHVADYMISEYRAGRTPNPDILCNREIKFGLFRDFALASGASYIATGHYAQIQTNQDGSYSLVAGNDIEKDQSYFLYTLTQEDLRTTLFPIGHMKKKEVRERALRAKLPIAIKKDSQGVCMLGDFDMKDFLQAYIPVTQGDVLSVSGEIIGYHKGAILYTLGERHQITITKKDAIGGIYYVVDKNIEANTLTVSTQPEQTIFAKERMTLAIDHVTWVGKRPDEGVSYMARVRYRAPLIPCIIEYKDDAIVHVIFSEPILSASVGQSVVIYKGMQCLGGGRIT